MSKVEIPHIVIPTNIYIPTRWNQMIRLQFVVGGVLGFALGYMAMKEQSWHNQRTYV